MIVNPFKIVNYKQDTYISNKSDEVDIKMLQKYLVDNYLDSLKKEEKNILTGEIEKYLYEKYSINDIKIVEKITNEIFNKIFGYDILQKYIDDRYVSDIRAVSYNRIYIKYKGVWKKENISFESEEEFYNYIKYCILKNNSNINFDVPIVVVSDKKYNLRIEAGIPPVNAISPNIVIRIHRKNETVSLEKLFLIDEMLNSENYIFLSKAIKSQKNIVICGKGGSGKTTLLKALINKIPDTLAITTNEETIELFIEGKNIIQREILNNRDDCKKITLEKLTKHSLVMSNDIIIIGELKGAEALVFFDSIATGHMGLTTVHSDSAYTAIDRLTTLIKRDIKAQLYKEEFIKQMLANSINYVIFMKDYKVNQIVEIKYDREFKKILTEEIYIYKK